MFRHLAVAALASLATIVPAQAQMRTGMTASPPAAPYAEYESIRSGRLQQAEAALLAERVQHPRAPEIALNLAAVYAMTGRAQLAAPLYDEVLASKAIAMDMPSGSVVSSHDVARTGASRLNARYAAR